MARTPDARETSTLVMTEDIALSLDPEAAPILRKVGRGDFDEEHPKTRAQRILVGVFVFLPMLALIAAIPFAWGWGLNWHDVLVGAIFYWVSGLGVTVGYHRYFTHLSFKAKPALRVALGIAGSLAMEGPVINWVADHRRHHKYSDREGDPHSPWRYGDDLKALTKGLLWAHVLWLFDENRTSKQKYAPDLLADKKIRIIQANFPTIVAFTLLAPAVIGGFWNSTTAVWSWHSAIEMFFWASLVRVTLLHHVTWSTNSICHTWGDTDWVSRDRSVNVAWLSIASFGESWHNLHHADPTCARHGALKGQIDQSARVIKWFEKLGWARDVRWPDEARLNAKRAANATRSLGGMTMRNEKATKLAKPADKAAA